MNAILDYGEKGKPGRGRWLGRNDGSLPSRIRTLLGSLLRRKRIRMLLALVLMLVCWILFSTREHPHSPLHFILFMYRGKTHKGEW